VGGKPPTIIVFDVLTVTVLGMVTSTLKAPVPSVVAEPTLTSEA
jgi:hypothetical protein